MALQPIANADLAYLNQQIARKVAKSSELATRTKNLVLPMFLLLGSGGILTLVGGNSSSKPMVSVGVTALFVGLILLGYVLYIDRECQRLNHEIAELRAQNIGLEPENGGAQAERARVEDDERAAFLVPGRN